MTTILRIQTGGNLQASVTRQIGQLVLEKLESRHPNAKVVTRDLAIDPIPHIDPHFVSKMFSEGDDTLVLSNRLIEELFASDIVLIESPMYNFGIPSVLKAWIDHVVRAHKTFEYSQSGVEGLLKGKKTLLVLGNGGVYSDGPFKPMDFQEPYLRATLGFIGLTDLQTIRIEGLFMGAEQAIANAKERVSQL